jgi:hypothetical protein
MPHTARAISPPGRRTAAITTSVFLAFFFIGKIRGAWPEAQAFSPEGYLLSIPGPSAPLFRRKPLDLVGKGCPPRGASP